MMYDVAYILIVSDLIKSFSYLHQFRHVKYHEHIFPPACDAASGKGLQ